MGTYLLNAIGAYVLILLVVGLLLERRSAQPFEAWLQKIGPRWRGALALFLALVGWCALMPSRHDGVLLYLPGLFSTVLDYLSYFIHEGGHFILQWATRTVHLLGGTLFQLGFPLALCCWYLHRRFWHCAALAFFWFGHELPGVGRYIADARAQKLGMLSPDGMDDWHHLLGTYGLLDFDRLLGFTTLTLGVPAMIAACALFVAGRRMFMAAKA